VIVSHIYPQIGVYDYLTSKILYFEPKNSQRRFTSEWKFITNSIFE
jgi:hypothetical protein